MRSISAWPPTARKARAFTLIEVTVSLAILSILMLAMGSVILLASTAAPTGMSIPEGTTRAAAGIQQLAADAAMATAVTSGQATSFKFIVPDRDASGAADILYYHWSGTPGDALLLSRNNGPDAIVIENVRDFNLSYLLVPVTTTTTTAPVEGPEIVLSSYDPASYNSTAVSTLASLAQSFTPTLPNNATAWSITKVQFRAKTLPPLDGSVIVEVRAADALGFPTGSALWSSNVAESTLTSSFAWKTLTVSNVKNLAPTQNAALIIRYNSGLSAAGIGYVPGANPKFNMLTAPLSLIWTPTLGAGMAHTIYGTVTASSTTVTTKKYLDRITISIRAGHDQAPRVESQVRVLCRPEVQ